jgi:hypothetical protein
MRVCAWRCGFACLSGSRASPRLSRSCDLGATSPPGRVPGWRGRVIAVADVVAEVTGCPSRGQVGSPPAS